MELLFIDGLPPTVGKGSIVRLLIEVVRLNKNHIGTIMLNGGLATIEIVDGRASRMAHLLDGRQFAPFAPARDRQNEWLTAVPPDVTFVTTR